MNIDFRNFSPNNDYRYSNMIVRTIKILRNESGYGFTLSRYVVQDEQANQFYHPKGYPVSSTSNNSFQQLNTSINLNEKNSGSYEIVFVKHVKIGGSAYVAGLREGDRPICINNIPLSDKSYSDIISIIEQSGLVLELKVIASSSSSLSSIPFSDQSQLKLNQIAEKPSTFQQNTRDRTSSPIRRQTNLTSDYSTLGLTPNSNLVPAESLTNRTHRNTIGLGSLGMSALFYSFLKNNAKGTGSPADSGYESRIDNSGIANRTSGLCQDTEKNSPNKSLPLAQLKLKNLQEVIAKTYSKEEFSKYGIMVPNVQSASVVQNKENLNRAQYNNYSNSGSIGNPIDSKFNQKYINYNAPALSTKGEDLPASMSRNPDYKYHPHGNQDDHKLKSPLTNPFYYDPKISYKFDTKQSHPFFQPDLTNLHNNRQSMVMREQSPSAGQHPFFSPHSSTKLNSTSPPMVLSPISHLSSNSVLSSSSMASSNSSNSTVSQAQTNTTSTLNYFQDCDSSIAGSSFNLNKSAPNTFSKYIETVHRALYDEGHRYHPLSTASSDLTPQAEFPINKPKVITTNQETLGGQQVSKQFVENRRQIFERTNKMENKSFSDKSLNRKPSLKNQSNNFSFDETRDLERTPTPTSFVQKSESFNQSSDVTQPNRDTSLITDNKNKEVNPLGNRYLTNFSHANRSSYRGECKRLMSRANLETVAERAAHFEDVDPERYEKLKSKFVDLDTAKQDEIHLLLMQHQHHQQQLLNSSLNKKTNSLSPVRLSKTNENDKNDSNWNYGLDSGSNQNYFFHHVNSRNPYVQAQLNPRKSSMFNKLDSSSVSTPMSNLHEVTSSFNPHVDNMASPNHQFYNDSNNESNNFKIQQLIAKRRSITSSPIRKNTTNTKTSHQIQSFEINSNETEFRKSKIFEGSNSSKLPRPSPNKSKSSNKSYTRSLALNSDAGETTSTDSDIGTSPSGITLASPPSSPQQPQQSSAKNYYTKFDQSNRSNFSPNTNNPSLNYSSIIRQHSYLNAVQLNDFKINKLMQSNFAPINEHEAKDYDFLNPSSVPYYYSPSSTVMRQQKLLQIQHQQQHQSNQVATSTPTIDRSKSTHRAAHGSSADQGRTGRVKSAQASSRTALQSSSNQESDGGSGSKLKKNEPKQTRNTSIKKLKSFFGERTPVVLQAVENKNVIASDAFLAGRPNKTLKEGVLICKMVLKDGKRSTDRSWRPAWAVLKQSGELFLCKEKKDNVMVPSMDSSYPINIKNSLIDIAYDYTKRKNVFKIRSVNCEFLFQTIDHDSMLQWIRVMQESANDSLDKLVTCMSSNKNWLMNTIECEHNSLDLSAYSPKALHLLKSMHNSNEAVNWSPDDSYSRGRAEHDVSPRRADNRKWVRQMTRRIKDFMGSGSADPMAHEQDSTHGRNFGIALERCEASTVSLFVPVVIEVCTRLVECHIVDEGLYRKVGQKQVVLALRAQLNAGVMSVDVSDYNWDNPHAVVSLLKCFLNELPDSLTTSHLYNEFIQVCRGEQHHGRVVGVKKLLGKLPKHNYETLKYLSAHLRRVAAAYQHNKMTIKNLSIAFSQSIVRHNEANCETIRSDHLAQSLLIELILIYHDWLFDPSQTENIPMEIKDSAEQHLSQQYCSYIEPIAYSDLLINIIKLLRSRWNSNNSSMSTPSNTHHSNDSGYYSNLNANRQPINIQFKREKPSLRSSKSVTAINRGRTADPKSTKQIKGFSIKQSFKEAKQRSRSVDTRFKPLGFILGFNSPSTNHTLNSYDLEASQTSLNRRRLFKKKKSPTDASTLSTHQHGHKSTPLTRKSYATKTKPLDLKQLERANETNLDRLNKLMKKLEIDLINAQMEVIEDDYRKTDAIKCKYISSSVSSSSSTSGVVAGSSSSCVSASPMVRKMRLTRAQRFASLSSISSSYEDLSIRDAKKIVRRHTIAGLLDQSQQECRDDLINFNARKKENLAKKTKKFNSKSIADLACYGHLDKPEVDCQEEKDQTKEEQVKRTLLNFSSPLSISASSVSSLSTSTSSLNKVNGAGRVAVSNLADEVGSIGLAVSQLSNCVNESLL